MARDSKGRFIAGSGSGGSGSGGAPSEEDSKKSAGGLGKVADAAKKLGSVLSSSLATGGKLAASAISSIGSAALALGTGAIPSATQAMSALGAAAGGMISGAGEKLNQGLSAIGDKLSGMGPEGAAAAAALQVVGAAAQATAEVLGATVGTLGTLMGMAIEATEKLTALKTSFAALSGTAAGGEGVQRMLEGLNLPFAKAQVNAWGQSLLAAGVHGRQLESDVKAIAAAEALMAATGKSGGDAAMKMFKRLGDGGPAANALMKDIQKGGRRADQMLKEMGLSLADLGGKAAVAKLSANQLHDAIAKALQKKGAGPLDEMGSTMSVILMKAQEGFQSLFKDLAPAVKPFMKEVKALFAEFNKGGAATKGLRPIVTSVLGAVFKYATQAVRAVHQVIQGFMGMKGAAGPWQRVGSVIRTIVNIIGSAVSAVYKFVTSKNVVTGLKVAFVVLAAAAAMVMAPFIAIGAVLAATLAVIGAVIAAMVYFGASMIESVGAAWSALSALASAAVGALSGLVDGALSAASNFIGGLVSGISAGAGAVAAAVAAVAKGALASFQNLLGIHSDSAVMKQMGGHFTGGAETGIEAGTPAVADKAAKLGSAAAGAAQGGMSSGKGAPAAKGGLHIDGGLHIHTTASTPQGIAEEAFAILLEKLAASQGV